MEFRKTIRLTLNNIEQGIYTEYYKVSDSDESLAEESLSIVLGYSATDGNIWKLNYGEAMKLREMVDAFLA